MIGNSPLLTGSVAPATWSIRPRSSDTKAASGFVSDMMCSPASTTAMSPPVPSTPVQRHSPPACLQGGMTGPPLIEKSSVPMSTPGSFHSAAVFS